MIEKYKMDSGNTDSVVKALKIFTKYTGFKPYATLALTGAGWLFFSSHISAIAQSNNVGEEAVRYITAAIVFGCSGALVSAFSAGSKKYIAFRKLHRKKKLALIIEKEKKKRDLQKKEQALDNFSIIFKYMGPSEKIPLKKMLLSGEYLMGEYDDITDRLVTQGFIKRGIKINDRTRVCYLTSEAKDFLEIAFHEEMLDTFEKLINRYLKDWRDPLDLFFSPKVSCGTVISGITMKYGYYNKLKHMVVEGVVNKNEYIFTIDEDFANLLIEKEIYKACCRLEVHLDAFMIEESKFF